MKKMIVTIIILGALLFSGITVSAESDPTGDVWHQSLSGDQWSWSAYLGTDKDYLDITDVSYSITGSTATLTMTTVDPIKSSLSIMYYMFISCDEVTYQAFYSNGVGSWSEKWGVEGGWVNNPISGNKFIASFPIENPDATYDIWGYAQELASFGSVDSIEMWADYVPVSYAPWYATNDNDDDSDEEDDTENNEENFRIRVIDQNTSEPIEGAEVKITYNKNSPDELIEIGYTDALGYYYPDISSPGNYQYMASKEGYECDESYQCGGASFNVKNSLDATLELRKIPGYDGSNQEFNNNETTETPGFELIFLVLAIALVLFWKRKK